MADGFVLTVSALNRYVKSLLDGDINLQTVYVKGEISNFKAQFSSGHYYMTIKDEKAQIRAAMFKGANQRLRFMPENNMSVIIRGRVTLYEQGGEYQLIIDDMQPDGTGALAVAFEQLKKRLDAEGLFDVAHKRSIPAFPQRVGVATSESGAAVRDIINVLSRRFPACEIVFCPVSVQGDKAAQEIAAAVKLFNDKKAADVIIIGRGGGSIEDLWAFNEEVLARAVYASEIPVISAVGHETDFTICDFVADLRAPTPSAAAELAVPDAEEFCDWLYSSGRNLYSMLKGRVSNEKSRIDMFSLRLEKKSPVSYVNEMQLKTDGAYDMLVSAYKNYLNTKQTQLTQQLIKLDSFNPAKIFSMGYSMVSKNGCTVTNSADVSKGDLLDVKLKNGSIKCEVI